MIREEHPKMNDFSDAFRQGEATKQKRIDAEKAAKATTAAKLHRAMQEATKWMEVCVDPVVADAKAGLADKGKISIKDTSNTPNIGRAIVLEMTGKKPYEVAFIVRPNGAVNAYRKGGEAEELGNINNYFVEKVREYLRGVVQEIGES
jgi:hypothetical protein